MTAPTLSVIIPVRNGGPVFRRCLAALATSTVQPFEFFVVDDGSTDDTVQLARQAGAMVLSTHSPGSGPAAARNLAAALATGDILFFFDSDVEIRPDTLAHIQSVFAHDSSLAALFGSYDDAPGDPGFLSQYRNLFHHYVHQQGNEEASTFWSGCGAIRRDLFIRYGGFSTRYTLPSIEDIELGYALKRAGFHIRLDKSLLVKHLKRWTLPSLLYSDIVARGIPWTRLLLREGAFLDDLNLQSHNRLSVVMIYLAMLCLLLGFGHPAFWCGAVLAAGTLLWLNFPLYQFMAAKQGWRFGAASIVPHWLYYAYNGLSFGVGSLLHLIEREPKPGRRVMAGKHKRTFALVVGGILIFALLLRVHDLGTLPLSSQEEQQIGYAGSPVVMSWTLFGEWLPRSPFVTQTALLLGEQPFWLRLGPVFASVLTVALLYRFTGRVWGRGVGTVAAALLTANAFQVSTAQIVMPYALVSLLALLSFHSLVRALKTNRYDSWIAYVVNTGLCWATYFAAVFLLIAQSIAAAVYLWLPPRAVDARKRLMYFWLAVGAVALTAAVILEVGYAIVDLGYQGGVPFVVPTASYPDRFYSLFGEVLGANGVGLVFIALMLMGLAVAFKRDRRFSSLLIIWAVVPTFLTIAYHWLGGINSLEFDFGPAYLAVVPFMAVGVVSLGTVLEKWFPRWKWATWITVVLAPVIINLGRLSVYYDGFK